MSTEKPLGAPASPSGSSLQPPAEASAAIPSADAIWALIDEYADEVCEYNKAVHFDYDSSKSGRECLRIERELKAAIGALARGIEPEGRESEGPRAKPEEPGPAGTRPEAAAKSSPSAEVVLPELPERWSAASCMKCNGCGAPYTPNTLPKKSLLGFGYASFGCQKCGSTSFRSEIREGEVPAAYTADQMHAYARSAIALNRGTVPAEFPARIMALLKDVADRSSHADRGPWQDGDGNPLQDDADAAIRWIALNRGEDARDAAQTEAYAEGRGDQFEDDCAVVRLLFDNLNDVDVMNDGFINTTRVRELLAHFDIPQPVECSDLGCNRPECDSWGCTADRISTEREKRIDAAIDKAMGGKGGE